MPQPYGSKVSQETFVSRGLATEMPLGLSFLKAGRQSGFQDHLGCWKTQFSEEQCELLTTEPLSSPLVPVL